MTLRDFRRFAWVGLVIAGLAALVTAGLFIVFQTFNLPIQISLALVIVGLAIYVLLDPQHTREALTGRQARYGSNALLMSLAVVGIVVVINYLVFNNTKQWDLTQDKQNTLAPETIKTLQSLKSPVEAIGYYTAATPANTAQTLLTNYKNASQGKFNFKFVDPNANPIQAQQDNISSDGTIVLKMDGRSEQVTYANEQDITGALVRLANPGKRVVYFLTGHGEYPLDTSSQNNYSQIKSALTAKNYTVNTLNLLASPKVPDDALAIIIAGPRTAPLSQQEVDLLKAYQGKGGSLVYMTEPLPDTKFGSQTDPMIAYLQQTWGIKLDNDTVVDPSSNQPLIAISQQFGSHAITTKMPPSQVVVMPTARSVEVGKAPSGVSLSALAGTATGAWGENNTEELQSGQVKFDQGTDLAGPINLAVAGSTSSTKARIVVIGDSDFASSQFYNSYGNSYFIINSIDWAANQDNLISLTPKQTTQRFLALPTVASFGLILLGSVFLLPVLVVVTGVTVWVQRRRRG